MAAGTIGADVEFAVRAVTRSMGIGWQSTPSGTG